jgi:hypothetical protein
MVQLAILSTSGLIFEVLKAVTVEVGGFCEFLVHMFGTMNIQRNTR